MRVYPANPNEDLTVYPPEFQQAFTIPEPVELQPGDFLDQEIPPPPSDNYDHRSHIQFLKLVCDRGMGERYWKVRQFSTRLEHIPLSPKGRALAAWKQFGTSIARCLVLDQLADHVEEFGVYRTTTLLNAAYQSQRVQRYSMQQVSEYLDRFHPRQLVLGDEVIEQFTGDEIELLISNLVRR